jgi:hypothetical protein
MHLFAAIPSHSGAIDIECARSLVLTTGLALNRGWDFSFHSEGGSTVSLVRNAIAAAFLQSGADLLLMIDSDQGIGPEAIERMVDFNQPVVGCMYPRRGVFNWSDVDFQGASDVEQILYQAQEYVGRLIPDEAGQVQYENGFARAEFVGTGVLLVRREAFERLMEHYPDLAKRGFGLGVYPAYEASGRWGFFNPMDNDEGVPLSEDLSFCRRWRQTGGDIWADITSPVVHVGRNVQQGNYLDFYKAKSAQNPRVVTPPTQE